MYCTILGSISIDAMVLPFCFNFPWSVVIIKMFDIIDWKINKNHCNLPIKTYFIKTKFLPSSWTEPAG